METEIAIEDVVEKVLKEPAPLLFPDTCSLVDIIRLPIRAKDERKLETTLKSVNNILSKLKNTERDLWVVISPPIQKEWLEHSQNTKTELLKHFNKLDNDLKKIHSVANYGGINLETQNIYENSEVDESLYNLSKEIIDSGIILIENSDCVLKGSARAVNEIAPAKKGKSHKDCLIIEHVLWLCTELKKSGFDKETVFLTSNTDDFCEISSNSPKSPLDEEFSSVNLKLATNWNYANHLLKP